MGENNKANNEHISKIGDKHEHYDSCYYTKCTVSNCKMNCLIDNGSTTSLISVHQYNKIITNSRPSLQSISYSLLDVNGKPINVYGKAEFEFCFENGQKYNIPAIVCEVEVDGILGQDFLCGNIKTIDYENDELVTKCGKIRLYPGGNTNKVCRITVDKQCTIQPNTSMWIPVNISEKEQLSKTILIECIPETYDNNFAVIQGIIHKDDANLVNVINYGEEPVILSSNTVVGQCSSVNETESTSQTGHCSHIRAEPIVQNSSLPEYLNDVFTRGCVHLNESEKVKFKNLLIKYQSVFAKSSTDLGCTDIVEHHIDTQGARPVKQALRKLPLAQQEAERVEVQKLLEHGIIEPSISPWSSPIVLVKKKSGEWRLCVDFRKVNALCKRDAFPLPNIGQCLDSLGGNSWFSTMDLAMGYHQMSIAKADRDKTAFSTSLGLFQFCRLPFGLAAAPSEFSRLMGEVLRGLQYKECCLFMDDIISPSETVDEQLERLEHIFQRLLIANLKLKPSKCNFFQKSCKFLGHTVSEEGIGTDEDKIEAVKNWKSPTNKEEVRSFIGLASYYKKFVKDFGEIAKPLYQLTQKAQRFKWSAETENAFQKLKEALTSAPILAYPRLGEVMILDTDSSQHTSGAVLSQLHDGKERVVAYLTKTMNVHELKYCTMRKELLAVVVALKHFHHYLYGQEITLRTDNSAVSWLKKLKNPTGQTARWLQLIETYDITVLHRPGKQHGNADALSRPLCKVCSRQEENDTLSENEHFI